jgi:hypothetical protein
MYTVIIQFHGSNDPATLMTITGVDNDSYDYWKRGYDVVWPSDASKTGIIVPQSAIKWLYGYQTDTPPKAAEAPSGEIAAALLSLHKEDDDGSAG